MTEPRCHQYPWKAKDQSYVQYFEQWAITLEEGDRSPDVMI